MSIRSNIGRLNLPFACLLTFLSLATGIFASDRSLAPASWPQFRGPNGSGIAVGGDFPTHFGAASNLLWKTALPGGNSSPCVWGQRIFLTAFESGKLLTLCVDRLSGAILWSRELEPGKIERGAQLGSPTSPTPATDGSRVYVYFGPFGLICYNFAGVEQWRKPLPEAVTQHGAGTSPILTGDSLLLNCDQDVGSYLLAVKKQSGETTWRTERSGSRRGFSTPLLWPADSPEVIVVAGTLQLKAYDLKTGVERWNARGLPNEMVTSPVAGDGLIFVSGWTPGAGTARLPTFDSLLAQGDRDNDGKLSHDEAPSGPARQHFQYIDADKDGFVTREEWDSIASIFGQSQNALLAIRPDGRGDVTDTHIVWKQTRGLPYAPSPLYYEGRVYLIKNGGLASCFDARSGKVFYQEERIGALGDYYASPVAANGKICVASQPGVVVILRAGDTLDVLARNAMDEPIVATPAIVGKELYIRTKSNLYAFRELP